MRRAAKVDATQDSIVAALRKCGVAVAITSGCGVPGFPDLVCAVAARNRVFLVECKDGALPPSKRALTPDQDKFHAAWPTKIYICERAEDVPALVCRALR